MINAIGTVSTTQFEQRPAEAEAALSTGGGADLAVGLAGSDPVSTSSYGYYSSTNASSLLGLRMPQGQGDTEALMLMLELELNRLTNNNSTLQSLVKSLDKRAALAAMARGHETVQFMPALIDAASSELATAVTEKATLVEQHEHLLHLAATTREQIAAFGASEPIPEDKLKDAEELLSQYMGQIAQLGLQIVAFDASISAKEADLVSMQAALSDAQSDLSLAFVALLSVTEQIQKKQSEVDEEESDQGYTDFSAMQDRVRESRAEELLILERIKEMLRDDKEEEHESRAIELALVLDKLVETVRRERNEQLMSEGISGDATASNKRLQLIL